MFFSKTFGFHKHGSEPQERISVDNTAEKSAPCVVHALMAEDEPPDIGSPPTLMRGGTKLRTPYEIHGYQFIGTLNEKPPGPVFLAVRSGAAVWTSGISAMVEATEDGKRRSLVWKSERLNMRIMHPSQELLVELIIRRTDFDHVIFGETIIPGIHSHPEIGAERIASARLYKQIHQTWNVHTRPQLESKPVEIGTLDVKLYYTSPDDFEVSVLDAHKEARSQVIELKMGVPDVSSSNPLPLLNSGSIRESLNEEEGDETEIKDVPQEPRLGSVDEVAPSPADQVEDHLLNSELSKEFRTVFESSKDSTMSGSALTWRADVLLKAAHQLETRNFVDANVRQSLDHLLCLVKEEKVRSGAFFNWIEDLMWDLANLAGKEGGAIFTSVYGCVLEYPILARPTEVLRQELPAIKGLDLQPLTFGLNTPDRCIVLRATSAADYIRWTAALSTYLDPLNVGRDVPRYCRLGCQDERELVLGLLSDDEDGEMPAVLSGHLMRKKVTKSRLSSASWVRRHFTLRALPSSIRQNSYTGPRTLSEQQQESLKQPMAQLEWTHSSSSAGMEVLPLQPGLVTLSEPCSPSGASEPPPPYFLDIEVLEVKGLLSTWTPQLLKRGKKADDYLASAARSATNEMQGGARDELSPNDGPYLTVTDQLRYEHHSDCCNSTYKDGEGSQVFGFPAQSRFQLPMGGQEIGGQVLESEETIVLNLLRKNQRKGDYSLGSAKLLLNRVSLDSPRTFMLKLYDVSDWSKVSHSASLSYKEVGSVLKNCPIKGILHISIMARRVHQCLTHWPCAFVTLNHNHNEAEVSEEGAEVEETSEIATSVPLSLSYINPSSSAILASGHLVDHTPALLCKVAPEALLLYPSSNGAEDKAWLKIPYDCIEDILRASPCCLHLHLSGKLPGGAMGEDKEIQHHQDMGKCAMEERARNTVIKAKQTRLSYKEWLKQYVGEGDYDAEFTEPRFRLNEKWHARWDAYSELDTMSFEFTDEDTLEIDIQRLNAKCDVSSVATSLPSMPSDLDEWRRRGGNAILRITPCPAAALVTLVRERLTLHRERKVLDALLTLPDWAHFEVAEAKSEDGKIGVAVQLLDTLRAKQAQLLATHEMFETSSVTKAPLSPVIRTRRPTGTVGKLGRPESMEGLVEIVGRGGDDVFDFHAAQLFRIKFYIRRLYDSCTYPIWRRSKSDFRQCIHSKISQALTNFDHPKQSFSRNSSTREEGEAVETDVFADRQLAASDEVERTVVSLDRLLKCLHHMLGEVALAFPMLRAEYLRHAGLLVQTMYLTIVSEIGRHVGSSKAIGGVTMEALLMLLDILLKRNTCVADVLEVHLLKSTTSLELTAMLEVSPLLSRFTNRTVLEMVQFSERTVKAYEQMVYLEAYGPCIESPEGKWWSRCPEDMMSVTGMYLKSVQGYCRGQDRILAKVIASVLSSFMIHVKSIGRQFDAIAAAFYANVTKCARSESNVSNGLSLFRAIGFGESRNTVVTNDGVAEWSGELSIQYLCAVINDIGRVINIHLTALTSSHEKIIDSEGLGNGILEVQDVFYAMGNRGATLIARLLVESLELNEQWARLFSREWAYGGTLEVSNSVAELNRSLLQVHDWIDENAPFFPRLVASASDFFAQAYLWRLVISLDPSAKKATMHDGTDSVPVNFWGSKESEALNQDISSMSKAFSSHFPDATSRSLDEIRETQQILKLPLKSPEEDDESFSAAVDVLLGMVRTHPRHVHARLVKFIELTLVARIDVDSETTHSAISTLVLGLEAHRRSTKKKYFNPKARTDLFTLLFDDGATEESDDDVDSLSNSVTGSPRSLSSPVVPVNTRSKSVSERVMGTFFSTKKQNATPRASLVSESTDRLSQAQDGENRSSTAVGSSSVADDIAAAVLLAKQEKITSEKGRGKSPVRGSVLSKELMRHVVMRYKTSNEMGALNGKWEGAGVEGIVSDSASMAQHSLEVTLIEATSLPVTKGYGPKCTFAIGEETLKTGIGKTDIHQRRVLWNEVFNFQRIFNIYGTDLDCTIYFHNSKNGSEKPMDRFVIPLACLDVDQVLDDWYLLSQSNGMVRLRLLLRQL